MAILFAGNRRNCYSVIDGIVKSIALFVFSGAMMRNFGQEMYYV